MIRSKYSSLIGMVITLILIFGLDQWQAKQVRLARQSSDFQTYYIWIIIIGFAAGAILYALSWLTLLRSQKSAPISTIFIIIGLVVYSYPILYVWAPVLFPGMPLPYIYSYSTPLAHTGIFIAVLGVLHLSLPKDDENVQGLNPAVE